MSCSPALDAGRIPPNRSNHSVSRRAGWLLVALLVAASALLAGAIAAAAPNERPARLVIWPNLALQPVVTAQLNSPVHVTHAGDNSGRLFIVEQVGTIRIYSGSALVPTPFLNLSDRISGCSGGVCMDEQGLLSVAFPPDYAASGQFYVYYTRRITGSDPAITISRFQVMAGNANLADPNSEQIILSVQKPGGCCHNGGQLQFGPDGYLYAGTGDSNNGFLSQDPTSLFGKLLRLNVTGVPTYTIPVTNPFTQTAGARPEIWSLGLRNPWRFSFDRLNGELYIGDVGASAQEEIDFRPAGGPGGENYGWPNCEGSVGDCSGLPNYVPPVYVYTHAIGCSVTGGYVYRGAAFPRMQGIYYFGDFCGNWIRGLQRDGPTWVSQQLLPPNSLGNPVSFGEDQAGDLYVVAYSTDGNFSVGSLYKLVDVTATPTATSPAAPTATRTATPTVPPVTATPTRTPTSTPTTASATSTGTPTTTGTSTATGTVVVPTATAAPITPTPTTTGTPILPTATGTAVAPTASRTPTPTSAATTSPTSTATAVPPTASATGTGTVISTPPPTSTGTASATTTATAGPPPATVTGTGTPVVPTTTATATALGATPTGTATVAAPTATSTGGLATATSTTGVVPTTTGTSVPPTPTSTPGVLPTATSTAIVGPTSTATALPGAATIGVGMQIVDLNGGDLLPGDVLDYTITVANTGAGPAGNVVLLDPIPAGTSYQPGSLSIVSGPNSGPKTDPAGDDQAEYDGVNNRVVFRLGTGATATTGGLLNAGESSSARFRVRVTAGVGTSLINQASVTYVNLATGATVSTSGSAAPVPVVPELPVWALFGSGLLALGWHAARRRRIG